MLCSLKRITSSKCLDWRRMRTLDHSAPRMPRQEFLNVAWKAPYLPINARNIFLCCTINQINTIHNLYDLYYSRSLSYSALRPLYPSASSSISTSLLFSLISALSFSTFKLSQGWTPGFFGSVNGTRIWIAQAKEIQKSSETKSILNRFPGNSTPKTHFLTFAWALGWGGRMGQTNEKPTKNWKWRGLK